MTRQTPEKWRWTVPVRAAARPAAPGPALVVRVDHHERDVVRWHRTTGEIRLIQPFPVER
jgi:hypothetical protein